MTKIVIKLFGILLLALLFTNCGGDSSESSSATGEKPKSMLAKEEFAPSVEKGKEVYNKTCIACHMTGVTGSPKLTETERWGKIAEQGLATLYKHALEGFTGEQGVMPPKGGNTELSDEEIKHGIAYMLDTAGATAK